MAEHVNEWLGAYLDGELYGWRLQQVERHLAECQACSTELEELRSLSSMLRGLPMEGVFSPADRFADQVLLQLPRQQERSLGSKTMKAGWWLAPATLLGAWVFAQTVMVVSWLVWAGAQTGMLGQAAAWVQDAPQYNLWIHTTLSLFNGRLASAQPALSLAESWGQSFLAQMTWLAVLAGLYWTWLASWWFRRQHLADQNSFVHIRAD